MVSVLMNVSEQWIFDVIISFDKVFVLFESFFCRGRPLNFIGYGHSYHRFVAVLRLDLPEEIERA